MTATFYVGDAIQVMGKLPEKSVDLVLTSPPFLALRSYLPADHPDKNLEGGSQATPGEYVDWLLDVVEACARVLAPHGSLVFELGDTYSGSGGAGGDYDRSEQDRWVGSAAWAKSDDGAQRVRKKPMREGQPKFGGAAKAARENKSASPASEGARLETGTWTDSPPPPPGKLANYADARGNPDGMRDTTFSGGNTRTGGGTGWPLAKSLSLIPESFRFAMVYGHNPHTGRTTPPWRLRNVIRWVRPNPPVGALGDKFRPATSELMVFCKAKDRYFDLDAVREPFKAPETHQTTPYNQAGNKEGATWGNRMPIREMTHSGAPPLDWWNIPPGGYVGAHYAVWPPELLIKPVKAMTPERVCRTCGEPSRRIVRDKAAFDVQPKLAAHIKERREAAGVTSAEINEWFGFKEIAKNWERTDPWGAAIPSANVWAVLKERLDLSDDFDEVVLGDRRWTESTVEYLADGKALALDERRTAYDRGGLPPTDGNRLKADRKAPDTFSDCGHNDWRPGVVLDPFGGSGTTALVATGHGRDCTLIDLDERNYELALDRVGPLILERAL